MNLSELLQRVPPPLRRRPVLIAAGAALFLLLVVVAWPRAEASATAYHEVRRGDFTVSIVEGGTLTAVSDVSVRNEVEGTARVIYIVPEGSYVKKGDLLVELDSAQAQDQANQQDIAVEKARFALIQAQAQLDIQRSTTNSNIRAAALKLKFAELDLQKFNQGQQAVDLIEASNKLVQAEAQLSVNLDTYINSTNLAAKGYETKQKVDGDRLSVLNNQNSVIVASNQIWMLKEFDIPKLREQYESAVAEAGQELLRVVAQSQRLIAQYEADLITQSNTLALSQRKLDRDRKNLEGTKIRAPQDGLVVYPVGENRFSQESLIEEGATVRNRQELIKLPDTSRMKVTIKVHESHVGMVRRGLPAYVILDSLPDQRFAGFVERVGLLPDTSSRWGNPNLKVYNTDVLITDPLPDIKPGVSARAEVIVTNIANALSVPIQAITTLKGKQVAYLARRGGSQPQPVEVGLYNTRFIEITSGLREGDRVLLAPPLDTETKTLDGSIATAEDRARAATNAPPVPVPAAAPGRTVATDRPAAPDNAPAAAAPGNDGEPRGQRPGAGGFNREEMMKRFDADGNGELDDTERAAMRQAFGGGARTNRGDRARGEGRPRATDDATRGERPAAPREP